MPGVDESSIAPSGELKEIQAIQLEAADLYLVGGHVPTKENLIRYLEVVEEASQQRARYYKSQELARGQVERDPTTFSFAQELQAYAATYCVQTLKEEGQSLFTLDQHRTSDLTEYLYDIRLQILSQYPDANVAGIEMTLRILINDDKVWESIKVRDKELLHAGSFEHFEDALLKIRYAPKSHNGGEIAVSLFEAKEQLTDLAEKILLGYARPSDENTIIYLKQLLSTEKGASRQSGVSRKLREGLSEDSLDFKLFHRENLNGLSSLVSTYSRKGWEGLTLDSKVQLYGILWEARCALLERGFNEEEVAGLSGCIMMEGVGVENWNRVIELYKGRYRYRPDITRMRVEEYVRKDYPEL